MKKRENLVESGPARDPRIDPRPGYIVGVLAMCYILGTLLP